MPSPRRWIWPWGHAYAVLLPVLLILVACSGSQPLGTGPKPPVDTTDTLVLWGGFGYLDRRAQPQLDKLLFESGRDESLGIMLRDEVAGRVLLPVCILPVFRMLHLAQSLSGSGCTDFTLS